MADDFFERAKRMQNIHELFTEVKNITAERKRHMVHTTMNDMMRDMLQKFCAEKHLTLANGLDMAVFYFLYKSGLDLSQLEPLEKGKKTKKAEAYVKPEWYICGGCTATSQDNSPCSRCGSTEKNKI